MSDYTGEELQDGLLIDLAASLEREDALKKQLTDISIANMKANNLINAIYAALRDRGEGGVGRYEAMKMVERWYAEGDV